MKNGIKTLATWLILGVIFLTLVSAAFNNPDTKMNYSELISKIKAGEVSAITISSSEYGGYLEASHCGSVSV